MKFSKILLTTAAVLGASAFSEAFTIDLYMDAKTKQIYGEPGPGRQLLGTFERVEHAPSINGTPAPQAGTAQQPVVDKSVRIKEKAERAQPVGKVESSEEHVKKSEKRLRLDKNGLQFETADRNFRFKIGGRIHTDYTHSSNDDFFFRDGTPVQANDGAELRRGRLEFAGTFFKDWDFKSQIDFADNSVDVKDMSISYTGLNFAKLTVGQQKQPFSRELQESSNDLMFMERSLMNVLNASLVDRAIGLNASNSSKNWTGQIGIFGESIDRNNNSMDESWGSSSRITFAPINEKIGIIHLGVAGNYRRPSGSGQLFGPSDDGVEFRYETSHVTNLFPIDSGTIGNIEDIKMLGLEASSVYGPLSIGGEYAHSWISRNNGLDSLSFHGWYGEAAWTLTGESRNYKEGRFFRVNPARNFSFSNGGLGAWELAARIAGVDMNDGAFSAGEMKNFTVALNWYVNSNVRFMFNYDKILEIKDSPLVTASGGKPDDLNTFMFRSQITF